MIIDKKYSDENQVGVFFYTLIFCRLKIYNNSKTTLTQVQEQKLIDNKQYF